MPTPSPPRLVSRRRTIIVVASATATVVLVGALAVGWLTLGRPLLEASTPHELSAEEVAGLVLEPTDLGERWRLSTVTPEEAELDAEYDDIIDDMADGEPCGAWVEGPHLITSDGTLSARSNAGEVCGGAAWTIADARASQGQVMDVYEEQMRAAAAAWDAEVIDFTGGELASDLGDDVHALEMVTRLRSGEATFQVQLVEVQVTTDLGLVMVTFQAVDQHIPQEVLRQASEAMRGKLHALAEDG